MKLRKLGGILLVTLGLTGCGSGLSGAGVVGATNAQSGGGSVTVSSSNVASLGSKGQFGGPDNLVRNGSFEHGVSPWVPFSGSKLALTSSVRRFGRLALVARPKSKSPTSAGAALVDMVARPAYRSRYSFSVWVKSSPRGGLAVLELAALRHHKHWVRVGARIVRPVTGRWQQLSARGTVLLRHGAYLRATVALNNIAAGSWLAIDGARAKILSPGSGTRSG